MKNASGNARSGSAETKDFIDQIETETGVPVTIISTGPDLVDTIDLRSELL